MACFEKNKTKNAAKKVFKYCNYHCLNRFIKHTIIHQNVSSVKRHYSFKAVANVGPGVLLAHVTSTRSVCK